MKFRTTIMAGVAAGALAFAAISAQAATLVTIDDFEETNGVNLQVDPVTTSASVIDDGAHAGIIGGYRDVSLEWLSGASTSTATVDLFDNGLFQHNQDSIVTSQTTLTWDGLAGGGFDFDGTKFEGILIELNSSDSGLFWELTLCDSLDNCATTLTESLEGGGNLLVLFSAFTGIGSVNLADLDSFSILANSGDGGANPPVADLDTSVARLSFIDTPEPTTLSILGAGLLGLGALARRRRKA